MKVKHIMTNWELVMQKSIDLMRLILLQIQLRIIFIMKKQVMSAQSIHTQ